MNSIGLKNSVKNFAEKLMFHECRRFGVFASSLLILDSILETYTVQNTIVINKLYRITI